jgi:hypothetical protein
LPAEPAGEGAGLATGIQATAISAASNVAVTSPARVDVLNMLLFLLIDRIDAQ